MVKEGYKEVSIGPKELNIPIDWELKYIKDIAREGKKTFTDGDWVKSENMVEDGEYQLIQLGNIGEGFFKGKIDKFVDKEFFESNNCTLIEKGDLLISRMASPVLRTVVVPEFEKKSITSVDIVIAKVDKKNWDVQFIKFILNSKMWSDLGYIYASGSTRKRISRKNMEKLKAIYPPLSEQKKIASILSSVDKSIEKTDEVIEETKKVKKGLMRELLTKGIGNSKFKEVRIGTKKTKIPQRWNILNLEELVDLRNGKFNPTKNLSDDFDIPVYGGNGITGYYNEPLIEEPTIVIGRVGEYCGSIHLVKEKTWVTDNAIYINEINDKNNIYLDYLALYLKFANLNNLSNRTGQPKLTQSRILTVGIPVPPLKEQNKIASILSSVDAKIQKEEEYKAKLERLKNGLMQKLLTGEIRVNTDMEV